ncbi:DUF4349 domain-containing protein [Sphingomonadaceae bacterium jetA1]|uniref:DUF4349 domain-containing protein n=1 Tax=Facivitalis istanbulensis TaxID=3075838 RepID=UPI0034723E38
MRPYSVLIAPLLLIACGSAPQVNQSVEKLAAFDTAGPAQAPGPPHPTASSRIAYSYTITYVFDRRGMAQVQERQMALCRSLGPSRCLVMKSSIHAPGPKDDSVTNEATLLVDARIAAAISHRLDALAKAGDVLSTNHRVEAEDVTRQVIDTDARVRAKQALAARLLAIIQSGKGNVGELVQAERAYAATQEELDAARGEQANLAQRVAMSPIEITYVLNETPGAMSPIRASIAAAGQTLTASVAALITAIVAGLPWLIVGGLGFALLRRAWRRWGWRWPRRARTDSPTG